MLCRGVVSQTTVQAENQLCLSGDNQILKLFVDGRNLTPRLRFKNNLRRCDCVDVPSNTGLIAIEAKNWRGPSGIQACIPGNPTNLKGWVCDPIRRFKRKWAGWTGLSYDDSRWRKAKRRTCLRFQRCYEARARTIPCNPAKNKCFWSKKPGKRIRCRLNLVGAGIDPPPPLNCEFGSATVVATGEPTCNRKCCLDVNVTENNMQLTDGLTGDVDTYSIQADGYYFAIVDIDTCTFIEKEYNTDIDVVKTLIRSLMTSSSGAAYSNAIGVATARPIPELSIVELGNDVQAFTYSGYYEEFKTCITGVKNGEKQFSEPDTIEFVPQGDEWASENLARGKSSWQSSTVAPRYANVAVDGNRESTFSEGSCTATAEGLEDPFWAVDLGQLINVGIVQVTNRGDCCPERLNNIVVGLTNNSPRITRPTVSNVVVCANGPAEFGSGLTLPLQCAAGLAPARYVVILGSAVPVFTICEVEVNGQRVLDDPCFFQPYGNNGTCEPTSETPTGYSYEECPMGYTGENCATEATNLAMGKSAWQSSTQGGAMADRAVDGNRDFNYIHGSCSHAGAEDTTVWAVDLEDLVNVDRVVITNRGLCCQERLNNIVVALTNTAPTTTRPTLSNTVVCADGPQVFGRGQTLTLKCVSGLAPARYVVILSPQEKLTLCEVEVYGEYVNP